MNGIIALTLKYASCSANTYYGMVLADVDKGWNSPETSRKIFLNGSTGLFL